MKHDIIIRKAAAEDIPQIAEIERAAIPQPWSENAFRGALSQEHAITLAAVCGDEIAGFVTGAYTLDFADIYSIATSEKFRRKGIGEMLVKAFCESVPSEVTAVGLEVRESNSAAIALYEKCGFVRVGMRKNFYDMPREHAILYTKEMI